MIYDYLSRRNLYGSNSIKLLWQKSQVLRNFEIWVIRSIKVIFIVNVMSIPNEEFIL